MIEDKRATKAEEEFEAYVFEEGCEPVAVGGWEWTVPGDEMTRPLFFAVEEEGKASLRGHFTVRFEDGSDEICAAWASLDGNDVGHRPNENAPSI